MKILHINTSDKSGGAAIAAFRLHNAMLESGIKSTYFVLNRTIKDRTDIVSVSLFDSYIRQVINKIFEKITVYKMRGIAGMFSSFKYGIDISKRQEITEADIIYLHWICGAFINYHALKCLLKTGKLIIWFMHDMFPITGGCHHSFDCIKYQTECRQCPYCTGKGFIFDLSVSQFKKKKKLYKKFNNLIFAAPSAWLADCARKSGLTRDKPIYHIPNVIDIRFFRPIEKKFARELFFISGEKKIIAFGAHNALSNPCKGWDYLKNALDILSRNISLEKEKIEIMVFGSDNKEIEDSVPFRIHFIGYLHDDYSLVMAYNCADVFVIPSLAENFPNVILESLSCNIPVVGFNVGGIPDMVNEDTGYLAEYKNSHDLAKGIALLLTAGKKDTRIYAAKFFSSEIIKKHEMVCALNYQATPPPPKQ
jgi:glycosyltransferase involved in cell wall biosynthesis